MENLDVIIEGRDDCSHRWRQLPTVDISPPQYSHVCEECGRVEEYWYDEDIVTLPPSKNSGEPISGNTYR